MMYLRKANERGKVNFGWLTSRHSFSFGHYYDAKHMGFSALRVINDDIVQAGRGFETHGHRDMEIVSYVVSGALKHKDNTGNEYVVPAGDIQVMSAGRGIMHSEFNPSSEEPVNFLQIWIAPNVKGGTPGYMQKTFGRRAGGKENEKLELLVSDDGRHESLRIKQNASISRLTLRYQEAWYRNTERQKGYLHIISGVAEASVKSEPGMVELESGDAIGIYEEDSISLTASQDLVALWFDLPI
ncbi:pirin family protein [Alteromonas sp. BL110]|uniref:pirin family protein n=1 Tax=Alteromonas sp. BL110 TaxID=1714845 RepID=UPI000E509646|nr:pirin family protein [Alteromonas sp. BL110]AXT40221.1 pirin family protein [Alteromonas sp. BL110]RKM79453.1 cupin domain-containing protein [Alteromonas sp. BL110]